MKKSNYIFVQKKPEKETSEEELWNLYLKDKSIKNRNAIVEKYLYLLFKPVRSIYPVCRSTNELEDIFQAGVIGLIEAVENYSPENETNFKTFSRLRIHGSIIDYLRKTSLLSVSYYTRKKLQDELKDEFDTATHLPQIVSLSDLQSDKENDDYISNLLVDLSPSVEDIVTDNIMLQNMMNAINNLPINEYTVIAQYYFKNKTLNEISENLSMSRTAVWQLRGKAISKVRKALDIEIND